MFDWIVQTPTIAELEDALNALDKKGYSISVILPNKGFYAVVAYKEKR